VHQLNSDGIDAIGVAGSVTDRRSLVDAFDNVKARLGPIDVLEYSPAPRRASSWQPVARLGNFGVAAAALRHWVLSLNPVLAEAGVYAAHVPIGVFIGSGGLETQPEAIAKAYWDLYTSRDQAARQYGSIPDERLHID
jgi:hypothetical protein